MKATRILGISGSLRKGSKNTGLLRAAKANLPEGVSMEIADISNIPFFNSDLTERPEAVEKFFDQLAKADAFLMASPEYNYSIAPALKNAIDWASRYPDNALLKGKAVGLLSAGGGMGGAKAQYHLRQVFVYLDLHAVNKPEVTARAFGDSFTDDGDLVDPQVTENVRALVKAVVDLSGKLSS